MARVTQLELDSHTSSQRNSEWTGISSKGIQYNIIGEIPAQLFHDIFEVVRYYTENGYKFLVEKYLTKNERNYDETNKDIEIYGIDESTDRDVQYLGYNN